jgi:ribosome-associated toxin RatA of RatAB toxin-antitoxin module
MMTVDLLLNTILISDQDYLKKVVSQRDYNTFVGLHQSASSTFFITEKQAYLLVKLFKENQKNLEKFTGEITETITNPTWSRPFRKIEQVRKLSLVKNDEAELVLCIEYTFSASLRNLMHELGKKIENFIQGSAGKIYYAAMTEQNIVTIVDELTPHNFIFDETIKNHYDTIKSWSEESIKNQFLITNIENINFQKHITNDLGISTTIDNNIINDRSMRYQYFTENAKNHGETLTEVIANRPKTKIWIDKKEHSLADVIQSLKELRRLPILVVFDNQDQDAYLENLEILSDSLEKNKITNQIGIYFRLQNSDIGKQFNQLISNKKYNAELNSKTTVAAVQSGKIPKFFLKNPWKPMSVITLDTRMGLRHGKTGVYANCCDLVIEYANTPSMLEQRKIFV